MFTPAAIGSMISQVADTFEAMLPDLGLVPGITDATLTQAETSTTELRQGARDLVTGNDPDATIEHIGHHAEQVLQVLAALPLPTPLATGFRAAQMLLPTLVSVGKLVV